MITIAVKYLLINFGHYIWCHFIAILSFVYNFKTVNKKFLFSSWFWCLSFMLVFPLTTEFGSLDVKLKFKKSRKYTDLTKNPFMQMAVVSHMNVQFYTWGFRWNEIPFKFQTIPDHLHTSHFTAMIKKKEKNKNRKKSQKKR